MNSFEKWLKRPVYVVQCKTWALANLFRVPELTYLHTIPSAPCRKHPAVISARKELSDLVREYRRDRIPFPELNHSIATRVDIESELKRFS
jgi:hypothetical protein